MNACPPPPCPSGQRKLLHPDQTFTLKLYLVQSVFSSFLFLGRRWNEVVETVLFWKEIAVRLRVLAFLHPHTNRKWMHVGHGIVMWSQGLLQSVESRMGHGRIKALWPARPRYPSVHVPSSCTCVCLIDDFVIIFHGHIQNKWEMLVEVMAIFVLGFLFCFHHSCHLH